MYIGFASMYDELMENIPYQAWGGYIKNILHNHEAKLVLDMACGTGTITTMLAQAGFDMIGVDSSIDMLNEAQQKMYDAGQNILFLAQDMRALDLYGTIDAAISVCDGLNYILEAGELEDIFKKVKLFLNPGGLFIFDMVTEYKFTEILGQKSFEASTKDGGGYEMDNNYNPHTKINQYRILFKDPILGEEFLEVHEQRAYAMEEIVQLLQVAGFADVKAFHEYTDTPPRADSVRITYIAQ